MTEGQKIMGLDRELDPDVRRVSELAAEIVDIMSKKAQEKNFTRIGSILHEAAIERVLAGKMFAVAYLTNRH